MRQGKKARKIRCESQEKIDLSFWLVVLRNSLKSYDLIIMEWVNNNVEKKP
jgi:hypothetical protein